MLNLVQVQERLRDVPMQALMQYANGSNPQIPPFLALGELNRRKKMQESAAAEQAQEMEGAPTVKEQIEQSAGLLALQGSRQKQAARQQAGLQAAMPMAAPNTTTSEPAQLAAGGFLDDIVVPRDFQRGGQAMNPEMLKKLMMLQAMKKRQGVAGLPTDMFKRSDYAGGGIVAFQKGGEADPIGRAPYEEEEDLFERLFGDKRRPLYRDPKTGLGPRPVSEQEARRTEEMRNAPIFSDAAKKVADAFYLSGEGSLQDRVRAQQNRQSPEEKLLAAAVAATDDYPDESRRGSGSFATERDRQGNLVRPDFTKPFFPGDRPSRGDVGSESGLAAIFQPRGTGAGRGNALSKYLGMDPKDVYKAEDPRKIEDIMSEQKRLQGLAGISEDFLTEREKRLADLQARREESRAGQPMEQLTTFLSGIAEGRGGNWATQGARGAKASQALRTQQEALRDKQDMEMEELKFITATKRDAIRRGDLKDAQALEKQEKEIMRDMIKNQVEMAKGQAAAETQGLQAQAYMMQSSRPTGSEQAYQMYLAYAKEKGLRPTVEGFLEFKRQVELGGKVSGVYTKRDAMRDALKENPAATPAEVERRANELLEIERRLGGASGSSGSGGRTVDFSQLPK